MFEHVKLAYDAGAEQAAEDLVAELTKQANIAAAMQGMGAKALGGAKGFLSGPDPKSRLALMALAAGVPLAALASGGIIAPLALGGVAAGGLYAGSRNPGLFGGSVKNRLLLEMGEQMKDPAKAGLLMGVPAAAAGVAGYSLADG